MARHATSVRHARTMQDIEKGLKMLNVGLRRLAREVGSLRVSGNGRPERKRPVTRALRLQGRYMGLIRTLPPRLKAKVKGIRARQGVEQAIRKARSLKP
ncbi:MAG TPA: hypothetical protein VGQ67_12845 [Candidatus Polarisedimenticolia bacterium]|nr:hypothetical protein [Candidatus Polarisedimenticolia bacterium]